MKTFDLVLCSAEDETNAGEVLLWCLMWYPRFDRQLTRHAYPGQPATHTRPPTKPCTCWYLCLVCGLDLTHAWCKQDGVDLTWCYHPASPVPHRATGFRINPTCPHHGRQVLILNPALPAELTIEALWNDPALNAMRDPYDLDDNERRF